MFMIEMTKECNCGNKETTTHQSIKKPVAEELVFGYCSNCGSELNELIKNCNIYKE